MKKQYQCPECQSFKVASISPRNIMQGFACASLFLGLLLTIFIIGIPFLILAPILLAFSFALKEDGKKRCRNCNFIFHSI